MTNLKNKHLLILGGDALSADIVNAARQMGVITTVIDWHPVEISPAKLLADNHYEISIKDYEAVNRLIADKKIDGVITGFTDSYLEPYAEICSQNNWPCYASTDQFRITLDKDLFKKLCRENNVPTVPQFSIDDIVENKRLPADKILIKPVDSSGSRGINLISDFSEWEEALRHSLSFSQKKEVLVEKYMDADDVSICYTIRNGVISLSAVCDRFIHKTEKFGSVTSGLIYPSRFTHRYIKDVDENVKNMFASLGLTNGVLFLQAFVDDENFYFYEMGYRLSGGRHYIFTQEENNVSALNELISFALTGEMSAEAAIHDNPLFSAYYCQLSVLCKSEKVAEIVGINELLHTPGVIDISTRIKEGDTVGQEGTTSQIVARLHLKADSIKAMDCLIEDVRSKLHIYSESGEDLIDDFFHIPMHLYEE
ncbi:MAG: ATP-grasp domain-containing protein [Bacteroidales bacterium]|nr:ATP-grasp domain-containing protein [Bacteroidales bacterium]